MNAPSRTETTVSASSLAVTSKLGRRVARTAFVIALPALEGLFDEVVSRQQLADKPWGKRS